MNLLQLVFKQMRQRSLSTILTILSVLLGVAMAVSILIVQREGGALFGQSDFGFDVIVGPPKGSPLQLTLNTIYDIDTAPGLVPYALYEDLARKSTAPAGHMDFRRMVKAAVPFQVGDSFEGRRIVGTSPLMFNADDTGRPLEESRFFYRPAKAFELASGRVFAARKFEAVVGSDVAAKLGLKLYDASLTEQQNQDQKGAFRVTHGMPAANEVPDIHKPVWHIVGILKPTQTVSDRALFVPIISLFAIAEHESGLEEQATARGVLEASGPASKPGVHAKHDHDEDEDAYTLDAIGDVVPNLAKEEWMTNAVLVVTRGGPFALQLLNHFKLIDTRATAVSPALVMRDFFDRFLNRGTLVLLVISALVTVVAAASILTTIYNSVSARLREIAILRALGATRVRVLAIICIEAALIGFIGSVLGLVVGHAAAAAGSVVTQRLIGEPLNWQKLHIEEVAYVVGVVLLALIAGLVPALKAYRTPVATNLSA